MNSGPIYLLIPVLAILLVSAQAVWVSAIRNQHLIEGSARQIAINIISSSMIWMGALIYIFATLIYFVLLSRVKFFSVQISMMSISIIFSTFLAYFLLHEKISVINVLGMVIVLIGLYFVLG